MTLALVAACCAALLAFITGVARAQTNDDVFGGSDTVFAHPSRSPITYITTYDRDVSSGTWTQALSYTATQRRVAFSADGTYAAMEFLNGQGLGSGSGTFGGRLSLMAMKGWIFGMDGTSNKVSSKDPNSQSTQRQNRLKVSSQYSLTPRKGLDLKAILTSEFQQDHTLNLRPLAQEKTRYFTIYNAAGDSVGTDSIFVRDQRDSTYMSGRQDGLSAQADWRPSSRFRIVSNASGSRVRPVTNSYLRDIGRDVNSAQAEHRVFTRYESPNEYTNYLTRITYTGPKGLQSWVNLKRLLTDQQYFDQLSRSQEGLSIDQRGAIFHVEQSLKRGLYLAVDATVDRSLSEYAVRTSRTSLVSGRTLKGSFSYNPSPRSRAGMEFDLERHRNSRQSSGNGINLSHFMQATGAHRLTERLGIDGVATMSLTSYQYENPVLDRDNLRSYVNVGCSYRVSARCSTTVHFSTIQGHEVAIAPTQSGNNNVQSTYQMDATLRMGVTPRVSLNQVYILNAFYKIFDGTAAESKNVLSRIRRIDTTISDSLFTFVQLQLRHNFLFLDTGSFRRTQPDAPRKYSVASQTYQQTLFASVILKPRSGLDLFLIQSLGNTITNVPALALTNVDTRWNLAMGANVGFAIWDGAQLSGTAQHVGAYTERRDPDDPLRDSSDWIVSVSFTKPF